MSFGTRWLFALTAILALGTAVAAEPPVRLSEDGTAFLYRSQPGDLPGTVAERFGIRDLPAFLAANGIRDPSRVASGLVYRIPNPLAERAAAAEARAAALSDETEAARARARTLETEVAALTAKADELERRSASLARVARLWPWVQVLGVLLVFGIAAAGYVAYRATDALGHAERYARRLADELDERRGAVLVERQKAERRILTLENEVRSLHADLAHARRRPTGTH
jgi:hypothetical protein